MNIEKIIKTQERDITNRISDNTSQGEVIYKAFIKVYEALVVIKMEYKSKDNFFATKCLLQADKLKQVNDELLNLSEELFNDSSNLMESLSVLNGSK